MHLFRYQPSLDSPSAETRLAQLLPQGDQSTPESGRRLRRLDALFSVCLARCPVPLWAPGLVINTDWRVVTETFLPWSEIAPALRAAIRNSLTYQPSVDPLKEYLSWPDFLDGFAGYFDTPNPAAVLRWLLADDQLRRSFLFALFLPHQHGGSFDRYGIQAEYLKRWLRQQQYHADHFSCLDAACGTGEGTWDLLSILRQEAFSQDQVSILGSSLEPLEVFSAAHACFPHDPARESRYRQRVQPLITEGWQNSITFAAENLALPPGTAHCHNLIICNGLLGGPMLHDPDAVATVLHNLIVRLKPGGLLLAADRFHPGWRVRFPRSRLETLLVGSGMNLLECHEGIAAQRVT